jgi:hypothetical protein
MKESENMAKKWQYLASTESENNNGIEGAGEIVA